MYLFTKFSIITEKGTWEVVSMHVVVTGTYDCSPQQFRFNKQGTVWVPDRTSAVVHKLEVEEGDDDTNYLRMFQVPEELLPRTKTISFSHIKNELTETNEDHLVDEGQIDPLAV